MHYQPLSVTFSGHPFEIGFSGEQIAYVLFQKI